MDSNSFFFPSESIIFIQLQFILYKVLHKTVLVKIAPLIKVMLPLFGKPGLVCKNNFSFYSC